MILRIASITTRVEKRKTVPFIMLTGGDFPEGTARPFLSIKRAAAESRHRKSREKGSITFMNSMGSRLKCQNIKRFWGLPKGVRAEPAFAARASSITSHALFVSSMDKVRGTMTTRAASLVNTMDRKKVTRVSFSATYFPFSSLAAKFSRIPLTSSPFTVTKREKRRKSIEKSFTEKWGVCSR